MRFRFWAPDCRCVALSIESAVDITEYALEKRGDGWCERFIDGIGAGTRYRFRIDGDLRVPDAASRFQPDDVHGASEVIDPGAYGWRCSDWRGRPWEEAVIYELHVGTFTPEGSFDGVRGRLDKLVDLGVTAIELMPVADFPGARGWGYDGALLYAPDARYGRPDDLKALIDAAHGHGLMVLLDVVYNHFGPEGNYLNVYAKRFFNPERQTPWGAAINFDGPGSRWVREFFIENAIFWLNEYRFDGLRLDAVHAIDDRSPQHILEAMAERVDAAVGGDRQVHLILENDDNQAHYLRRCANPSSPRYVAQWNDDCHHAFHVLLTGECDGYYADFADDPGRHLARCLTEGFAYQGDASRFRQGAPRGEPSRELPLTAFINCLQNHDQVGNRAFGERLSALVEPAALRAAVAVLLLSPSPPLLFMGEEWAAPEPFLFFCDLGGDLQQAVREGRRREFSRFPAFGDAEARARIPDPTAEATFRASVLDWPRREDADHRAMLDYYRQLLRLRREEIAPRLRGMPAPAGVVRWRDGTALVLEWCLGDGARLCLGANLGPKAKPSPPPQPSGRELFQCAAATEETGRLAPWSVAWTLIEPV
ncbi:MAG: malto-oligosyltrehalose trehalohydrolase [Rhodospirillales bacterium]|nr:malto-oligosyltrehalose trehalohydrolase [Rhodospirillales bacterium]